LADIDGAIVGGESGPSARAMSADWVRSLRDRCGAWVGTLLTIFVVPTVYTWFARARVPGEITELATGDVVPAK
jgi:Protein of unknown function (DUF5131)